jgi:hypothetical protein
MLKVPWIPRPVDLMIHFHDVGHHVFVSKTSNISQKKNEGKDRLDLMTAKRSKNDISCLTKPG